MAVEQYISWYKNTHGCCYMDQFSIQGQDGRVFWHIHGSSQTDWYTILYNPLGTIWFARRIRWNLSNDTEHIVEMFDGKKLVYDGPVFEYPLPAFPEWYHATFHSHMFFMGKEGSWNICPANQQDWQTQLSYHSGVWLVESFKDATGEKLVRAYTGIDDKIYEDYVF